MELVKSIFINEKEITTEAFDLIKQDFFSPNLKDGRMHNQMSMSFKLEVFKPLPDNVMVAEAIIKSSTLDTRVYEPAVLPEVNVVDLSPISPRVVGVAAAMAIKQPFGEDGDLATSPNLNLFRGYYAEYGREVLICLSFNRAEMMWHWRKVERNQHSVYGPGTKVFLVR